MINLGPYRTLAEIPPDRPEQTITEKIVKEIPFLQAAHEWILKHEGWLIFVLIGATFGVPILLLI